MKRKQINCQPYIDFVDKNLSVIVKEVNAEFEKEKKNIRRKLLEEIASWFEGGIPPHYEWKPSPPDWYDHSGYLKEDGELDLKQTVNCFLENEYSGSTTATYESGRGLNYNTYGYDLFHICFDIAEDIQERAVQQILDKEFEPVENQEDMWYVRDAIHDTIYDETITSEFFWWEFPIKFVGIGEMTLAKVIEETGVNLS